jgi:hypothetical protein
MGAEAIYCAVVTGMQRAVGTDGGVVLDADSIVGDRISARIPKILNRLREGLDELVFCQQLNFVPIGFFLGASPR